MQPKDLSPIPMEALFDPKNLHRCGNKDSSKFNLTSTSATQSIRPPSHDTRVHVHTHDNNINEGNRMIMIVMMIKAQAR